MNEHEEKAFRELNLENWLQIAEHEAKKDLHRLLPIHRFLVLAGHHLTEAKRLSKSLEDYDGLQWELQRTLGLLLAAAGSHIPNSSGPLLKMLKMAQHLKSAQKLTAAVSDSRKQK